MSPNLIAPRRIALADEDRWFDPDRAVLWEAEDETLSRTHLGGWVLGREDLYQALSETDAVAWIIRHGHTVPPDVLDTAAELEYYRWRRAAPAAAPMTRLLDPASTVAGSARGPRTGQGGRRVR